MASHIENGGLNADPVQADAGRLVLVVDDQRTNRSLLVRLINMLGHAALAAENGAAAFEQWRSGRFALIITDCHMTQVDGYQLARDIRRTELDHGLPHTPILAWTSTAHSGTDESCKAAGMDGRLPKPVELETLAGTLEYWLSTPGQRSVEPAASPAAPLSADVTLDRSVLARYSGGDPEQERDILREFRAANAADLRYFELAMAQRDALQVAQAAHRLKGASRMVGALAFASVCERLEKSGRAGDWETIGSHREIFYETLQRLNQALNSC